MKAEKSAPPKLTPRITTDNLASAWFITGTDTEVGKTFVTCALLHILKRQGIPALGMKPIAAGTGEDGTNDDVEQIIAASNVQVDRRLVNPYLFSEPIAPHIAAARSGKIIDIERINAAFNSLREMQAVILVEGVGGFRVPLGKTTDASDLACALRLPIILVVGMRLGCINHALLTVEAIENRGLTLAGWVANRIDPAMSRFEENLLTLQEHINAPLLGIVPPQSTPETAATHLSLPETADC